MTASQKLFFSSKDGIHERALGAVVARLLCTITADLHEVKGSIPLVSILFL